MLLCPGLGIALRAMGRFLDVIPGYWCVGRIFGKLDTTHYDKNERCKVTHFSVRFRDGTNRMKVKRLSSKTFLILVPTPPYSIFLIFVWICGKPSAFRNATPLVTSTTKTHRTSVSAHLALRKTLG